MFELFTFLLSQNREIEKTSKLRKQTNKEGLKP